MAGRVEGKVAFITGAARGQGRSHAIRLAEEGADIIAIDICEPFTSVAYEGATEEDLAVTAKEVEALGRRIVARKADVRDYDGLKQALDEGVTELGRLDIVSANAGICSFGAAESISDETWSDALDVNLKGAWHTAKAAIPHLVAGGNGGSITITSSALGLKGLPGLVHYISAKHGVTGLVRGLAQELGPHKIRVNAINPTNVDTPMLQNAGVYGAYAPDVESPTVDDMAPISAALHMLNIPWVESIDISNALLFLASDEARYITAVTLPVDGGAVEK
jgi:(+)-trans-carveol dehydrogenase